MEVARSHYSTRGSNKGSTSTSNNGEPDLLLRWGNQKRLRCVKQRSNEDMASPEKPVAMSPSSSASRTVKETSGPSPRRPAPLHQRVLRNSEEKARAGGMAHQMDRGKGARGIPSLSKDGNGGASTLLDDKKSGGTLASNAGPPMLPKFSSTLTMKEKEEDFMMMKGIRLPHRPKKRPKQVQRAIDLICRGMWLSDITSERYEVREKKTTRKRPRGLKGMQFLDSDSE